MTTVPSSNYPTEPNMLYLQHYSAESDDWNIKAQCITCRRDFQDDVRDLASYVAPDAPCICNVCRRQPPSLLASAANVLTKFVFNLQRFELAADTPHVLYVYATTSGRVGALNLLPPEYPNIRVWFRSDSSTHRRLHHGCPGTGPWNAVHEFEFKSLAEAISALIREKDIYWCSFCSKPLFFPDSCDIHPD
jgi:hypothetical protein